MDPKSEVQIQLACLDLDIRQLEYAALLGLFSDTKLLTESLSTIWYSEYKKGEPDHESHWRARACKVESDRRGPGLRGVGIYERALTRRDADMKEGLRV